MEVDEFSRLVDASLEDINVKTDFQPREYQVELLEIALKQNSILYLPTGSGKTFIATMVMKELSKVPNTLDKKFSEGGKLTFFLANTVALVLQQSKSIRRSTHFKVGSYYGDLRVDDWSPETWREQFDNCQVLVMTSQIFLNLLQSNVIKLSQVNLIVFDECHHSVNNHPMRQVMQLFQYCKKSDHPRILGLTATLFNSNVNPKDVEAVIYALETTLQSKIATATNDDLVRLYSTNPVEKIIPYATNNIELVPYKVCESLILHVQSCIKNLVLDTEALPDPHLVPAKSIPLIDPKKINKKISNILTDVRFNMHELGLYAGSKAALAHLIQVERLRLSSEIPILTNTYASVGTALTCMRQVLEYTMASMGERERIFEFSSPKVIQLFELLVDFKESNTAIVFVQRRFTAKVLFYVLKDLKDKDPRYANIKPEFMVGFNSNPFNDTREGYLQKKRNREVMARFDRGEVNVLTASDVIEEGMDIQLCNMVIKFDKPNDFRSYVQSKGRARSKTSQFFLFKNVTDSKFAVDHAIYLKLEESLINKLGAGQSLNRAMPDENAINSMLYSDIPIGLEPFMPSGPDGPKINAVSSISIVNQYCGLLATDRFSRVCPYWSLIKVDNKLCGHLILPSESKVRRREIVGKPMLSKLEAKQSVALATCKVLYEAGELNPITLLPIGRKTELIDDPSLVPNWISGQEESETSKNPRKKKYPKVWPECLSNCRPTPGSQLYLHVIKLDPIYLEPKDNRRQFFYKLLQSDYEFGILSTKKLPEICGFPLYLNLGELSGQVISNVLTIKLSKNKITEVVNFHSLIFTKIMDLVKAFLMRDYYNEENSFLMVPLKPDALHQFEIDWETISKNQTVPDVVEPCNEDKINLNVTEQSHLGYVVCPYYRTMFPYTNYIVTRVCHELNEESSFPSDEYDSYADYFIRKYDKVLLSSNQPLLEVRAISSKINCLKPRSVTKQRRKRNNEDDDFEETLVPELCVKFDFPAVYWLKATILPSVLHRLNQLLIAEEFRVKVAKDIGVGQLSLQAGDIWNPLLLDKTTVKEDKPAVQEVVPRLLAPRPKKLQVEAETNWENEQEPMDIDRDIEEVNLLNIIDYHKFSNKPMGDGRKASIHGETRKNTRFVPPELHILAGVPEGHIGPQQCEIMQALTSACSNDIVQYERLETLGDCFLKFSISLSLYLHFPDLTEGELTQIKGKVVGNKNLFYCGKKIGLGSKIKVNEFSPKEDWVPPGFCVHPEVRKIILSANLSPRVLFHLSVPANESIAGKLSAETTKNILDEILERADDDDLSLTNTNFISVQIVGDKTVSDVVEALIGVYLKSCGVRGALKLTNWMGIMKDDMLSDYMFSMKPPNVLLGKGVVSTHLIEPEKLQDILGYKFKDNAYILHALSHPSYTVNSLTKCYQRMEFLGDAIIDFLITCHIYEKCGNLSPGELTDLRSALVNNITLACLAVRYGLHKFMLARSCQLDNAVMRFVRHQEDRDYAIDDDVLFLREETDVKFAESVDVPKVLGDIFESLIGAIYLDSGNDLNVTWAVLYNFMKTEIDQFSAKVPKNHVRQLYEIATEIKFLKSTVIPENSMVMVPVEVLHENKQHTFVGFGDNKKKAKRAAAKLALRHIYHLE